MARAKHRESGTDLVKPRRGKDWEFNLPDVSLQYLIQRALGRLNRYSGPATGAFNVDTVKGIQKTLQIDAGYTRPIDGLVEGNGCQTIQEFATEKGEYTGEIDKKLTQEVWQGFLIGLQRSSQRTDNSSEGENNE